MLEKMFEKALKKEKKVDNGLLPRKNGRQRCFMPKKCNILFLLLLDKPRSFITVDFIFYAPNAANLGFLRIVQTIAL